MTVTAQVQQQAASQKLNPKYLTVSKTTVQPLKATPTSKRPRTEHGRDTNTTRKPAYLTNKLKQAYRTTKKTGIVLTTPHDITGHDKDKTNRDAWIAPAVATNEGDPRALQGDSTTNLLRKIILEDDIVVRGHVTKNTTGQPQFLEKIDRKMAMISPQHKSEGVFHARQHRAELDGGLVKTPTVAVPYAMTDDPSKTRESGWDLDGLLVANEDLRSGWATKLGKSMVNQLLVPRHQAFRKGTFNEQMQQRLGPATVTQRIDVDVKAKKTICGG